jgi:hypothetical protein
MSNQLPDDANIECPYQKIGKGTLICLGANNHGSNVTNKVTAVICESCLAGKIYREVGCDAFTPEMTLIQGNAGAFPIEYKILCKNRKRAPTFMDCRTCTLVTAPTTKKITYTTKGLFEDELFYSAYQNLEDARKDLREGDYDGAITSSVSCLESVLKTILDKKGLPYPKEQTVLPLWKAIKEPLQLDSVVSSDTITALLGTLTGAISHLAGMRNQISDAHGKGEVTPEVPYMLAELAINTASTLATLLVRRYIQIRSE